ncbi:hypothetical protein BIW11_12035 [Tropilaelaps mercedesae]|uniref:Uncharacterized protein n=1 Tax=Tropilaelaps mercedesae TaxID=418985 RepID=A0A1V9X8T5_9ACAR|nr:hypothetical protein BIW11_12035 [Tropilaelaps mercedesae]
MGSRYSGGTRTADREGPPRCTRWTGNAQRRHSRRRETDRSRIISAEQKNALGTLLRRTKKDDQPLSV